MSHFGCGAGWKSLYGCGSIHRRIYGLYAAERRAEGLLLWMWDMDSWTGSSGSDERVVCMEKTNIRYVTPEDIADRPDFASIDVSFISLTKVLTGAGSC